MELDTRLLPTMYVPCGKSVFSYSPRTSAAKICELTRRNAALRDYINKEDMKRLEIKIVGSLAPITCHFSHPNLRFLDCILCQRKNRVPSCIELIFSEYSKLTLSLTTWTFFRASPFFALEQNSAVTNTFSDFTWIWTSSFCIFYSRLALFLQYDFEDNW